MAKTGDEVLNAFQQTVIEEEVEVREEDKLRIGIIGTGWIAESHIESYKRMKDVLHHRPVRWSYLCNQRVRIRMHQNRS